MEIITTMVAWWGAVIATAVLAWDIYKWRKSGPPKLVVTANGNLQEARSNYLPKYIAIKVTNVGDKPTTLAMIAYRYFNRKPHIWSRKPKSDDRGFFTLANTTAPLPYKLDVGAQWSCIVFQTPEIEKMAREGYFYFEAEDTAQSNPLKFARSRLLL